MIRPALAYGVAERAHEIALRSQRFGPAGFIAGAVQMAASGADVLEQYVIARAGEHGPRRSLLLLVLVDGVAIPVCLLGTRRPAIRPFAQGPSLPRQC